MITDYGFDRNGSGYFDETALKAMRSVKPAPKPGEIWTQANGKEVLILSSHDWFCNVLVLADDSKRPVSIVTKHGNIRYTNPSMIRYMKDDEYGDLVRSIPTVEFQAILKQAADALGYKGDSVIISNQKRVLEEQAKRISELEAMVNSNTHEDNTFTLGRLIDQIDKGGTDTVTKIQVCTAGGDWEDFVELFIYDRLLDPWKKSRVKCFDAIDESVFRVDIDWESGDAK